MSHRKILITNFLSLSSVQVANYLLPLIVLPYLARIIGVEKFGTIGFAQAVVIYFVMLTTFGFNLYAPKEISIVREDKEKLQQTLWDIMYARIFLFLITILIYTALIFAIPRFRSELWVFVFSFGVLIGDILFPTWFFQGIEKMTYIAGFNFLIKILYTISIFIFIKTKQQYVFVPFLHSLSQLIVGLVAISIVVFTFKLSPIPLNLKRVLEILKKASVLFISNISISIYTKLHLVLLGFLAGDIYVGYYTASEKLFNAWMSMQGQLGATFYPHISKIAQGKDKGQTLNFIKKVFLVTMLLAIPATLVTFIFASPIITIIFGKEFLASIPILRILSFLFIIIGMSNVFGVQTMLPFNMKKQFAIPIITAGFVNLFFGFTLIPYYKHIGAALSFLFSEIWVTAGMFILLRFKGINLLPNLRRIKFQPYAG